MCEVGRAAAPDHMKYASSLVALLDERSLHFPAIPFLPTQISQLQEIFSRHRSLRLFGERISSILLWTLELERNRVKISSVLAVTLPTNQ
jgi:hypothetical protein